MTKFIEIDSTFRNRSDEDNYGPGEFQILSQKNESRNQIFDDTISDHVILADWRRANFSLVPTDTPSTPATRIATHGIQLEPVKSTLPDSSFTYTGTSDHLQLTSMLSRSSAYNGILHHEENYYWGANCTVTTNGAVSSSRVIGYHYTGNNSCHVHLADPVIIDDTSAVEISDPTHAYDSAQIDGKSNAWEFVPGGPPLHSYVGSTLYVFSQGVSTPSPPNTFLITNHDKINNLIELNNGINLNIIGPTDEFIIRQKAYDSSFIHDQTLHNYFGTALFTGATTDFQNEFAFKGDINMNNISKYDFIELHKPNEYGHILSTYISETQFTMTASGDPPPSTTDGAYTGCTIRFIMDKGGNGNPADYVSEDRIITAYTGATRTVTIDKALNNTLVDYTGLAATISIMIFPPVEISEISTVHNYNFTAYTQTVGGQPLGQGVGTNYLNLLNYTVNPTLATYWDESTWWDGVKNIYPYTSSVNSGVIDQATLFGASNMLAGSQGPLYNKVIIYENGGLYEYGWVKNHVIIFQDSGRGRRYQYNYLEIDTDLAAKIGTITVTNPNLLIKSATMKTPFLRNPYAAYGVDTKINIFNILRHVDDNHQRLILPQTLTEKKFRISLVNLSLPNKLLKCSKGGYITEYPYVYVKFRTTENSNKGSNGWFYSQNPKFEQKDFRVIIDNTVDDTTTSHVSLRSSDMTYDDFYLKVSDTIFFGVFMPDGSRFETIEDDLQSPYRPNPTLQISAMFSLEDMTLPMKSRTGGVNGQMMPGQFAPGF
jgi:hypothetical protein